jgi:DNA-binding CsgD family transcriptional regulator
MHVKEFSQAEIAEEMFIAEGTVRAHYGNIYRKLSVHSKRELSELLIIYKKQLNDLQ